MPTIEEIQAALAQVDDPELGINIVEAGMVRDIQIDAGHVDITLALTIAGCPLRNFLQEETQKAALSVPGVQSAEVKLTTMTDQQREQLKDRMPPALNLNQIGRVVAIMSGKGGVGKSSVTALLATALKRQGYQVGVLDADLTGPSIPKLFGISGPVQAIPMGILPVETRTGVRVMSTNLMLPEEDMAIIWRGPVMSNTIRQFWSEVLWGRLDYLLVDLPPGTSDATLTTLQSFPLDGVVLVTLPQGLSSMVVRKTVNMALEMKVPILGIVENMSYFASPADGTRLEVFGPSHTEAILSMAKAPLLGQLPIDPALTQLADAGDIESYEDVAYAELAAAFIAAASPVEPAPVIARMK
jgi:ATP-binding protein involved in chromosome partitioning